jgi:hypothetical protein
LIVLNKGNGLDIKLFSTCAVAEAMTNKSIIFLKEVTIMVLLICKYNELNNTIIIKNNEYDLLL